MKRFPIRTPGNGNEQGDRIGDIVVYDDGRVRFEVKFGHRLLAMDWAKMQLMVNSWLKSV